MAEVIGFSSDGYEVTDDEAKLTFVFCDSFKTFPLELSLAIHANRDAAGRLRPYYVLRIFGLGLTGGWLFEDVRHA